MVVLFIILQIASTIIDAFELVLLVYCVSSWFIHDPSNKFMNFLEMIVNPVLEPIRALLFKIPGVDSLPIDLSVLVAYLLCGLLNTLLLGGLF